MYDFEKFVESRSFAEQNAAADRLAKNLVGLGLSEQAAELVVRDGRAPSSSSESLRRNFVELGLLSEAAAELAFPDAPRTVEERGASTRTSRKLSS